MLATANTHFSQQQLFDEIDILPIDLKTKLVDKILSSLSPIDISVDEQWIKEVQKRKADIESGAVALVDGEEVFKKIAQKFNI
jgi:hypothetical protein